MDLDDLIVATYCLIDETLVALLNGERLRRRGPAPTVSDSEVLTMEVVGAYLSLTQDKAIFAYFRRHYAHCFPALRCLHRTTFGRQAAHLWRCQELLWQTLLSQLPHDPLVALVDSFPLPVCRFARANRCRLFRGEAAFGHDELNRQTYYGFRCHVRACRPGVIAAVSLTAANISDLAALPDVVEGTHGFAIGDRNYWSPTLRDELAAMGLAVLAPYRSAKKDRRPAAACSAACATASTPPSANWWSATRPSGFGHATCGIW